MDRSNGDQATGCPPVLGLGNHSCGCNGCLDDLLLIATTVSDVRGHSERLARSLDCLTTNAGIRSLPISRVSALGPRSPRNVWTERHNKISTGTRLRRSGTCRSTPDRSAVCQRLDGCSRVRHVGLFRLQGRFLRRLLVLDPYPQQVLAPRSNGSVSITSCLMGVTALGGQWQTDASHSRTS